VQEPGKRGRIVLQLPVRAEHREVEVMDGRADNVAPALAGALQRGVERHHAPGLLAGRSANPEDADRAWAPVCMARWAPAAAAVEAPGRVRLGVDPLVGGGSCRGDFDVVLEVELAIAILVVRRGGMSGHRCVVLPKNIRRYRGSVYYPASPVIRRVRAITDVD